MGLIIFTGVTLGQWLDKKYKLEGAVLTIIISLLAGHQRPHWQLAMVLKLT